MRKIEIISWSAEGTHYRVTFLSYDTATQAFHIDDEDYYSNWIHVEQAATRWLAGGVR